MGTLRRMFFRRIAEGILALAGVTVGLQWIEVGVVDNSAATAAARTFNRGRALQQDGRTKFQRARRAYANDDWIVAADFFSDAHVAYYESTNAYASARDEARRGDCDDLAELAETYLKYTRLMEDAASEWEAAADLRAADESGAEDHEQTARKLRSRAVSLVGQRIPPERDPQSPTC